MNLAGSNIGTWHSTIGVVGPITVIDSFLFCIIFNSFYDCCEILFYYCLSRLFYLSIKSYYFITAFY